MAEKPPSKRDVPIDPSIPPRNWGGELYKKNRSALQQMLTNNSVDHDKNDLNADLIEMLKAVRAEDYKKHRNKVARDKAAEKRKAKNKFKAKRKVNRQKTDSIRVRPAMLNENAFNMQFDAADSRSPKISKQMQPNSFIDLSTGDNNDNKNDNNNDNKNGNNAADQKEKEAPAKEVPPVQETIEEALRRIGLSEDQIDVFVAEDYEKIGDALAEKETDLAGMGFRRGAVKSISRKFQAEKLRLGISNDTNNVIGTDRNDVMKLLSVLAGNINNKNDKNDKNDAPKPKKLWDVVKYGGKRRHCFIGILTPRLITKYNRTVLDITLMSDVTDASQLRELCWKKTRSGDMNKVRCKYEEEKWPHASGKACQDAIIYLDMHKYLVIFESETRGNVYYCRFGRNIISTALALQPSIDDSKREYKWMKETSSDVQWGKYAEETYDEHAKQFRLCDFNGDGPDWQGFSEWIATNPDLRYASDPTEESYYFFHNRTDGNCAISWFEDKNMCVLCATN
eukprot:313707_1